MPKPATEADGREEIDRLASDLRHRISDFVRMIRLRTDTQASAQSETLDLLQRQGPTSIAALARRRGVKHQTMRTVVASLESATWVRIAADASDRRSLVVSITKAGRAELGRGYAVRTALIADLIETRVSRKERAVLRRSIDIIQRLTETS